METYGAQVVASPSLDTKYGRKLLGENPDHTGSLGIAISEAIEDTVTHPGTKYSLGSVFDFVLLHQTVIGQESIEQMAMAGEEPDVIIGCAGGGSNFAGLTFPWLGRMFRDGTKYRIIAAEPEAAPSLTRGVYAYDFGDTAQMTPLVKMHTLGHDFIPEPIHAGGLRYHGMSPLVSLLKEHGSIEARSVHQRATFEAGVQFARAEGILPGARADPRHQGRHRRGARGQGSRRGEGHPVQPVRPRPLRPGGLRALPRRHPRGLRVPAGEGRGGARGAAEDLSPRRMPNLSCRVCGRALYTVAPLESLFAEERRCPRCGAQLFDERRETERRSAIRRENPPDDPGPPPGDARPSERRDARNAERRGVGGRG